MALAVALGTHGKVPALMGERHANKPFTSFTDFYPHYLAEHSHPRCKVLHVVGTTLILTAPIPRGGFVPMMLIGATMGRLVAEMLTHWGDLAINSLHPSTFAIVGAAAMASGATHARGCVDHVLHGAPRDCEV